MEITHKQLNEQIKICYETKTPLFVWGGVGIGKSEVVKQTAEEVAKALEQTLTEDMELIKIDAKNNFGFLDTRISQLEPSDLRGLPIQDIKSGTTKWLIPSWLPTDENSKGIIFFDELNLSPPSIQAVAYQLILDRRIGDYVLPKGWVILSAGNRIEDKCSVFEMSSALSNRFIHSTLSTPTAEEWSEWAINRGIVENVISFANFKGSSFFGHDERNKDKAYPTPRSWAFCSKLIKGRTDKPLIQRLVASSVGEAMALEYTAFLKLQTKIDLDSILKNPEQIKNITEIDLKYVLIGTIAEKYQKDKKLLEKILPATEFLEPEFAILLLRFLKAYHPKHFKDIMLKKGQKILKQYAEILV